MKSKLELQQMLADEICSIKDSIVLNPITHRDYNQDLGNVSYILAALLFKELKEEELWSIGNWIDDSFIHNYEIDNSVVRFWGAIVFGKERTTKQWVSPFYCEYKFDSLLCKIESFSFYFGDNEADEILYEHFNKDRFVWDGNFYSNSLWEITERDWRFIFEG
jgi:hypothetical protein